MHGESGGNRKKTSTDMENNLLENIFQKGYEDDPSVLFRQLPNLFIGTPRICNVILLLIVWLRSFSKRLPSVIFAREKVLIFLILVKMLK